jgi:uncharacterized protein (TIGR00369 family)
VPATARERVHSWEDPLRTAALAAEVDGLTFLHAMMAGEVPRAPIASTLGFTMLEAEKGRVLCEMDPAEFHFNPIGSVHGGVYATLLDTATGCAVHSTLPAGTRYTSLDLTVKFLRPLKADSGPVRCEGKVVHEGSRMALAEARLWDAAGTLCATATSSCMIFRRP